MVAEKNGKILNTGANAAQIPAAEATGVTAAKPKRYYDYSLVFITLVLSVFGLIMVYSTSYYTANIKTGDGAFYLKEQAWKAAAAFLVMLVISKIDYHLWLKPIAILSYVSSIIIMLLTNFTSFGIEYNGKKRWFGIGGRSIFQPAELVKLAAILFGTYLLVKLKNRIDNLKEMGIVVVLLCVPAVFVTMNNMSSGIIIMVIILGMVFCASRKKLRFAVALGCAACLMVSAVLFGDKLVEAGIIERYQMIRIDVWKNPEAYASSGGWQVLQALYAIGSGGLFGKGLGNSVQKLGSVPEAQNDMIFSIICEELGLFGAICLILLFLYMFYRFMIIARNAADSAGYFLVVGVFIQIAIQTILNIAVVANVIPNTGVSLPFISYGGTSVFFLMAEMGIVLNVANQIELKE